MPNAYIVANPLPLLISLATKNIDDRLYLVNDYSPKRIGGRDYNRHYLTSRHMLELLSEDFSEISLSMIQQIQFEQTNSIVMESQILRTLMLNRIGIDKRCRKKISLILIEADWFLANRSYLENRPSLREIRIIRKWKNLINSLNPANILMLENTILKNSIVRKKLKTYSLAHLKCAISQLLNQDFFSKHLSSSFDFRLPILVISPRSDIPLGTLLEGYKMMISRLNQNILPNVLIKPHPNHLFSDRDLKDLESGLGISTLNTLLNLQRRELDAIPLEFFLVASVEPRYLGPYTSATSVLKSEQFIYLNSSDAKMNWLEAFNYSEFERIYH